MRKVDSTMTRNRVGRRLLTLVACKNFDFTPAPEQNRPTVGRCACDLMIASRPILFFSLGLFVSGLLSPVLAADAPPLQAERMEFYLRDQVEGKKIIVYLTPAKIRVEQPEDKFAFIYDVATQTYTGLELRDAHYWTFSWPKVQAHVQSSRRYQRRLQDLNIEGFASYDITRPDAPSSEPAAPQFIWRTGDKKKKIGEYECQLWLGENRGGKNLEAWCIEQRVGGLKENLDRLKEINEPMALVPVRPVLPPEFFVAVDSLYKAQVTPVEIAWGSVQDKSEEKTRLTLMGIQRKEISPALFEVPKTYLPSKLQALEGVSEDEGEKGKR